jgi:hypothetical protein
VTVFAQVDHAATPYWVDTAKPGHILFAACAFDQEAPYLPLEEDGKEYGAFTLWFVKSLQNNKTWLSNRSVFSNSLRQFGASTHITPNEDMKQRLPRLLCNPGMYDRFFLHGNHPGAELQDLLRFNGHLDERSTGSWNKKTALALAEYIEARDISNGMTKQEYIDHLQASKDYLLTNTQPVFLLIFSDPYNELSNLQLEKDRITDTLSHSGLMVQWEILTNCDRQTLINTFKKREFRNRIQFVYYSGKDSNGDFLLKKGAFDLSDFVDLFDYQENIKLFISNTCRSHHFAEYTTQLGVGLSIGIDGEVDDTNAAEFGLRIFELVSQGYDFMKEIDDFKHLISTYNRSTNTYKLFTASWVNEETKFSWQGAIGISNLTDFESPEIYALIVGIDRYVDHTLPQLKEAVQDARSFKECIANNENGNPENIYILLGEHVNQGAIDNAFMELVKRVDIRSSRQRLLLVYFSGYGLLRPDGPILLLPGWTPVFSNYCISINSYVSALSHNAYFNGLCCVYDLQKIFNNDAQGARPLFKLPLDGESGQVSSMVIGSIAGNLDGPYEEISKEAETSRGALTKELIKGLNGGAADVDGNITFETILNFLSNMPPAQRLIHKTIIGEENFIIATGKQQPHQLVEFTFAKNHVGKTIKILGHNVEAVFNTILNTVSLSIELKPGLYVLEIPDTLLTRPFEVNTQEGIQLIDLSWQFLGKWIWVAGTGFRLSEEEVRTAKAVGKFIAEQGYGLITGGWPGVDFLVSEAYYNTLESITDMENKEYLIQIVETGYEADFKKGMIQTVAPEQSKDVSREKAFVVISIGGKGGTYEIFQYARDHNIPFIPLPHTGGDSVRAYNELTSESASGIPGINIDSLRILRNANNPDSYLQLLQNMLDQLK